MKFSKDYSLTDFFVWLGQTCTKVPYSIYDKYDVRFKYIKNEYEYSCTIDSSNRSFVVTRTEISNTTIQRDIIYSYETLKIMLNHSKDFNEFMKHNEYHLDNNLMHLLV